MADQPLRSALRLHHPVFLRAACKPYPCPRRKHFFLRPPGWSPDRARNCPLPGESSRRCPWRQSHTSLIFLSPFVSGNCQIQPSCASDDPSAPRSAHLSYPSSWKKILFSLFLPPALVRLPKKLPLPSLPQLLPGLPFLLPLPHLPPRLLWNLSLSLPCLSPLYFAHPCYSVSL